MHRLHQPARFLTKYTVEEVQGIYEMILPGGVVEAVGFDPDVFGQVVDSNRVSLFHRSAIAQKLLVAAKNMHGALVDGEPMPERLARSLKHTLELAALYGATSQAEVWAKEFGVEIDGVVEVPGESSCLVM